MEYVNSRRAVRLTGLSTQQLREWTSRRDLIAVDIKPKGRGSPAQFSWQTILLLRLAVMLRDRFKIELQAHRHLFAALREGLGRVSFLSLWGRALVLSGGAEWRLGDTKDLRVVAEDAIILHLESHLRVISKGFSLPLPDDGQYTLFPAVEVTSTPESVARERLTKRSRPEVAV